MTFIGRVAKTAVAVGIPLAWSNWLLPRSRLDLRGRTAANAGFATGYALVFRGRPNWLSVRGLGYGLASASVVAAGYGAAVAIPALRDRLGGFADRAPDVPLGEWVAVHIPIGTVYSEELIFRATLNPLLDNEFGPGGGVLIGAATFGLWHIYPARAAGDSVPASIAATAAGGLLFDLLRRRTDSATAPALLHFAMNAGGALAPRIAARFASVRGRSN
ncbi:CPBP family intramembrane glutamic endopeptidase [Nocardia vinacea]|uniref:CPBP family intramembrane glutamic endopeptidase n=1 Tax=Nocardia vinacea TaxID=96468 RepID=UPI0002DA7638|nr:CPBP family intramembrane glutamic endopeptidase [Nocardia vinacea]